MRVLTKERLYPQSRLLSQAGSVVLKNRRLLARHLVLQNNLPNTPEGSSPKGDPVPVLGLDHLDSSESPSESK